MNHIQLVPADIRCLGRAGRGGEWCDRRDTCARSLALRRDGIGDGYGVLFRVCQPGAHDQYLGQDGRR